MSENQWEEGTYQSAHEENYAQPGASSSTRPPDAQENAERNSIAVGKVRRAMWFGGAAGVLPLPLLDLALISGVQIKLIADLSELYGISFSEHVVRSSIASLVGGILPVSGISSGGASMLKAIPVIGPLIGMVVAPAFAAATTWAVGRVFITHFESGGTLLDFNVGKARKRFQESYQSAKSE